MAQRRRLRGVSAPGAAGAAGAGRLPAGELRRGPGHHAGAQRRGGGLVCTAGAAAQPTVPHIGALNREARRCSVLGRGGGGTGGGPAKQGMGAGGVAKKARQVCPLVLAGVGTGWGVYRLPCSSTDGRGNVLLVLRLGQPCLCSQVLPLPRGVPPTPAPACGTQSLSPDGDVQRVLPITGVGHATQGQRQ